MKSVEPIRDINLVMDIAMYLKRKETERANRNYVLWLSGVYLGLRISDILKLRVGDIRNRDKIYLTETKTNKENFIPIPTKYKKKIEFYFVGKKDYMYLFPSRKKKLIETDIGGSMYIESPITRQQAYLIIKEACNKFGILNVGTHTMRKTFGYFLYKNTKDIELIREILNHSDISITRRYIGLSYETKQNAIENIDYEKQIK